nr:MAG TPA: hypothetical protein [Caudoviricetes sp.]
MQTHFFCAAKRNGFPIPKKRPPGDFVFPRTP